MKQITSEEFKTSIELDPAWALTITEPVEITGYCDLVFSEITHLSPLLHFTGRNEDGDCADFSECPNLKVAEGNFAGAVDFSESAVEKIGKLHIQNPNRHGRAAKFSNCCELQTAEGTFPGWVVFDQSGIQNIGDLVVTAPDKGGYAASFFSCLHLKAAKGDFPGFVTFRASPIETVKGLVINATNQLGKRADFSGCPVARLPIDMLGDDYLMNEHERARNLQRIAASKAQKSQPAMEI